MSECEKTVNTLDLYRERMELKDALRAMETKYERMGRRYERMRQCFEMLKNRYDEQQVELEELRTLRRNNLVFEDIDKVCEIESEELPLGLSEYRRKLVKEVRVFLAFTSFRQFYDSIAGLVIGQEEGLSLLLMSVYRYLCGIAKDGHPKKVNVLVTAPSGNGKTESFRALRNYFSQKVPSLVVKCEDVSGITTAGFKGREATSLVSGLVKSEGIGLIWLSEFDKLVRPRHTSSDENVALDVMGELLCMAEGGDIRYSKECFVNTSEAMFVFDGSFNDIRLNRKKTCQKSTVGFIKNNEDGFCSDFDEITRADILDFGCTAELLGRIPIIIQYHKLGYEAILTVIDKCRCKVSDSLGVELYLAEDYINELAEKANGELGCRLLESSIYNDTLVALRDSFFRGTGDNVSITLKKGCYEIKEIENEEADERGGKEDSENE